MLPMHVLRTSGRDLETGAGDPVPGNNGSMATHVALLRGINLGGRNKVAMADLRALVSELGHADAATYIQSGNVLFTAPADADTTEVARAMTEAIATTHPSQPTAARRGTSRLGRPGRSRRSLLLPASLR
jgi:Protein of unknown function (DUF1697)